MTESEAQETISQWLRQDHFRMQVLEAVRELALPQAYVAAGFLRNLIWDRLHQKNFSPLNDIDIIYYDTDDMYSETQAKTRLQQQFQQVDWDVKNQVRMHKKHCHSPYSGCAEAMSNWPEKETAIAVCLDENKQLQFLAPWGLAFLFDACITWNNERPLSLFKERVAKKDWLTQWPKLTVRINSDDTSTN